MTRVNRATFWIACMLVLPVTAHADFGFEVELRRQVVTDADAVIVNDEDLGLYTSGGRPRFVFTNDHKTYDAGKISNVELVTKPLYGGGTESMSPAGFDAKIDAYLNPMQAFVANVLYAPAVSSGPQTLDQLHTADNNFEPFDTKGNYKVKADGHPQPSDDAANKMYVQFSIGIPLDQVASFLEWLASGTNLTSTTTQAKFGRDTIDQLPALFEAIEEAIGEADYNKVTGHADFLESYIALVYTHYVAVAYKTCTPSSQGVVKNYVLALSRADLDDVRRALPQPVIDLMKTKADKIKATIGERVAKHPAFKGSGCDDRSVIPINQTDQPDWVGLQLYEYLAALFPRGSYAPVANEVVFGKTHGVPPHSQGFSHKANPSDTTEVVSTFSPIVVVLETRFFRDPNVASSWATIKTYSKDILTKALELMRQATDPETVKTKRRKA